MITTEGASRAALGFSLFCRLLGQTGQELFDFPFDDFEFGFHHVGDVVEMMIGAVVAVQSHIGLCEGQGLFGIGFFIEEDFSPSVEFLSMFFDRFFGLHVLFGEGKQGVSQLARLVEIRVGADGMVEPSHGGGFCVEGALMVFIH